MDEHRNLSVEQRIRNLHIRRKEILSFPAEKALDAILDHPQSSALVHSFPEEDFYFLIHDIGVEDCIELLSLASQGQWEYILDVEVWNRDRLSMNSVTKWLDLLLKADPTRLIKWFLEDKTEFVELYLYKNMEVVIREHDQDPSDLGEGFFTLDDVFYIRFIDFPYDHEVKDRELRDVSVSEFLNRLADYDYAVYQRVMLEIPTVASSEGEEEAFRLRNVRLAEKGFMPFEEAIGIYQSLKPEKFRTQTKKLIEKKEENQGHFLPMPQYPLGMIKEDSFFTRALQQIEAGDILQQLQAEFAGLCNQIISADQNLIREREALRKIVRKACGYLSIGLERLSSEDGKEPDMNYNAAMIKKFPLSRIFRLGYGLALELKWKAEQWREQSWFEKEGLPLSFWGEEWLGVLGGVLIKKPLFFDNYETGVIYREFASSEDIRITGSVLDRIIAFDNLLSLTGIEIENIPDRFMTFKSFVLTLWVRHYLGLAEELIPLEPEEFRHFFDDLWSGSEKPRKTKLSMKESFLNWLSDKTGSDAYDITRNAGETLEDIFNEIESEYGEVSGKDIDPRYIHLFLLNKT
ncbi:DUF6178 family protein [Desulfococcaceae bacterium HSG8]|nr:DUF6178 family protein [Desulfococcaceae bacterium HSG8]